MEVRRFWSVPHVERHGAELSLLIALAALLELAAGVGLAYVAGFSQVRAVVGDVHWGWLAVVAAGFGGLLAHGWGALDKKALKVAGADEHDAKTRATGLDGLELAVLALGGCGAAIAVLVSGLGAPPPDFTLPWAIIPVPAMLIGFWAAERYRDRFHGRRGWRGAIGILLEAGHLIRELFVRPRWGWAMLGMALFWAADAFAMWAGLAAFGTRMNAVTLLVGYATGMVFTRRTAPL